MGEEGGHSLGSLDSEEVVGGGRSRGGGEGGHWPLGVNGGGGGGGPRLSGVLCGGEEGSKGGQNHLPCLSMLITSTTSPSPNESSLSHMAPCLKVLGGRRDGG